MPRRCPPSLLRLVTVFRYLGIPSGGVNPHNLSDTTTSYRWQLWGLLYQILAQAGQALLLTTRQSQTVDSSVGIDAINKSQRILQLSIRSGLMLLRAESFFQWIYFSLPVGARLVRHLASASPLVTVDHTSPYLARSILLSLAGFLLVQAAMVALVNFDLLFRQGTCLYMVSQMALVSLINANRLYQLALFVYAMQSYREELARLRAESQHLTVSGLVRVKRRLVALQHHFAATNQMFQLPVLIEMITLVWMMIGNGCSLVTNRQARRNGFAINLAVLIVVRLATVIHFGQVVPGELDHLIWHLHHRIIDRHRTSAHWLLLLQIGMMRKRFQFSIKRVFTLDQALLVSITLLVLNYLVLLIQTSQGSRTTKATSQP